MVVELPHKHVPLSLLSHRVLQAGMSGRAYAIQQVRCRFTHPGSIFLPLGKRVVTLALSNL
jgi:hypothetical protein